MYIYIYIVYIGDKGENSGQRKTVSKHVLRSMKVQIRKIKL